MEFAGCLDMPCLDFRLGVWWPWIWVSHFLEFCHWISPSVWGVLCPTTLGRGLSVLDVVGIIWSINGLLRSRVFLVGSIPRR